MKRGFTLIEVLVASMLMGMLVSILTMVFNSSSVAWRTGKAGLAEMGKLRGQAAYWNSVADNALPGINAADKGAVGIVVGAWDFSKEGSGAKGAFRERAVYAGGLNVSGCDCDRMNDANSKFQSVSQYTGGDKSNGKAWAFESGSAGKFDGMASYSFGVKSDGPPKGEPISSLMDPKE